MKKIIYLAIASAFWFYGCSNSKTENSNDEKGVYYETLSDGTVIRKVRKAVNLLQPQKFHLNSENKALISGTNRTVLYIDLPPNTVEWYYYVHASKENSTNYIELATQLGALLVNPAIDINKIKVKDGNSYCDIYLMDTENKNNFKNKKPFKYNSSGSRQNFNSGIVKIKNYPEYCWLGIKNPRMAHAVDVSIEVVAIIEEIK
jgi:hypothetical protein